MHASCKYPTPSNLSAPARGWQPMRVWSERLGEKQRANAAVRRRSLRLAPGLFTAEPAHERSKLPSPGLRSPNLVAKSSRAASPPAFTPSTMAALCSRVLASTGSKSMARTSVGDLRCILGKAAAGAAEGDAAMPAVLRGVTRMRGSWERDGPDPSCRLCVTRAARHVCAAPGAAKHRFLPCTRHAFSATIHQT